MLQGLVVEATFQEPLQRRVQLAVEIPTACRPDLEVRLCEDAFFEGLWGY